MMQRITVLVGVILVAIGAMDYLGASAEKSGSLFTSSIGLVLIVCGWAAANEKARMHAMHAAVLAGLIGVITGFVGGLSSNSAPTEAGVSAMRTGSSHWPSWLTALVCGIYVILCVRSFVMARRARRSQEAL